MKKKIELILYSTTGCHLCDLAEQVVVRAAAGCCPEDYEIYLEVLDIADDDQLLAQYATRIPVLTAPGQEGQSALDWPFDEMAVKGLIVR